MNEIEYKIHEADSALFMAAARYKSSYVGGIIAASLNENEINLRHLLVLPDYRYLHRIGGSLHEQMVTWAKETNHALITTELVPKNSDDYEVTLSFLNHLGYLCTLEASNGRKFGFELEIK